MTEQRTADNTPHVYKYGAPDTCKHCGNRRSHEVHTMTDQQTAADNELIEKLVATKRVATPGHPNGTLVLRVENVPINPDGPEAAERIKSLQAEVAKLSLDVRAQECLQDSAYKAGIKAGWNLGACEDEAGFQAMTKSTDHIAELKRIKSLQAEVAKLTASEEMLEQCNERQFAIIQDLRADRQRMRDALERAQPYVKNAASQYISVGIDADLRAVDAALNPAKGGE